MELKERDKILIDIETTGFNKEKHQILEIGMLILRDDKVVDEFEISVKHPEYLVTVGAMKANKIDLISHDKLAIITKEAVEKILEFLSKNKIQEDGFIVLGQNIQFDIGFLEKLLLKEGKIKEFREFVSYRTIDIMQLAMIRNLENKIALENQNLDYLLQALNIDIPTNRHRALADCYLEFEVYKKLLNL